MSEDEQGGRPVREAREDRAACARVPLPIGETPRTSYSPGRGVLWVLVFLVLLSAATWAVRTALRSVPGVGFEDTLRRAKILDSFERYGDRFDGVFIGTSRFYRGVNPGAFDRSMLKAGRATRSINIAGNGLRMPEALFFIDWVLDQELANLRWLVIELSELDPVYRVRNRNGDRMINWHTTGVTLGCLDVIWDSERDLSLKWKDGVKHLSEWSYRQTSIGLGPRAFERCLRGPRFLGDLEDFDGYEGFEEPDASGGEEASPRRVRQGPGPLEDHVGRAPGLPVSQARILTDLVARIRSRGVLPIFVLMPRSVRNDAPIEARARGILPNLLDYSDAGKYPALFRRTLFWDASHLNDQGALVFSDRLARDVARLLEEAAGR